MSINENDICVGGGLRITPLMPFIIGNSATQRTLTAKLIANEMYQWVRDVVDIPGATSATYHPTQDDIGHLLRVRMHFTDSDNNFHTVISKPVGPIQSGSAYYVNAGSYAANSSGSSMVVPMPENLIPGNLVLVWMSANAPVTATEVAGWAFLNTVVVNDYILAYKIADGSEGASVTFGFSGPVGMQGQALQFAGVNAATPMGVHNTNWVASGTTASNAGVTTGSPRSLVLAVIQVNSNQVIPVPSGWTESVGAANNVSSPFAAGSRAVTKVVAAAGPSGSLSVPIASTSSRVSLYEIISA